MVYEEWFLNGGSASIIIVELELFEYKLKAVV